MSVLAAASRSARRTRVATGWLHLCNGLDPRRDGGMVPSILGMTGALAGQGGKVTILAPTPSRLGGTPAPARVTLRGPGLDDGGAGRPDIGEAVRGAEVVHLH